jgi:tetratricopeptide (TPR) repeat protein
MNWTCKLLAVALAGVAFFSLVVHAQSTAATELKLGIEAFNQSKYAEAIEHLEKAVSLDPENQDAHMYLANAYVKQHTPGVHTQENTHLAEKAIEQYQHVLDSNPNRTVKIESAKGIADMYLQVKKFDDSKKYYQMASDFDPKDPEPYVAIGGIDFDECTRRDTEEGAKLGLKPGEHPDPKNPDQKKACDELRAKNTPSIKEGIDSLNKAMELRPDDQGAMFYMSLTNVPRESRRGM